MAIVAAGFDRVSDAATLDDRVITGGLANCIAVVGIDRALGGMKIAHYNTSRCHDGSRFVPTRLRNFRDWFGNDTLDYRVGLGGIWSNAGSHAAMRHDLMMAILDVFDFEPRLAKTVISLRRADGAFVMEEHDNDALLPAAWEHVGEEIPYDDLN